MKLDPLMCVRAAKAFCESLRVCTYATITKISRVGSDYAPTPSEGKGGHGSRRRQRFACILIKDPLFSWYRKSLVLIYELLDGF